MQTITELWKTGAFTEDMIVRSLQCSYLDFRRALIQAKLALPDSLSKGMHFEIYRMYSVGADIRYNRVKWIADSYGISQTTASKFRAEPPANKDLVLYTERELKDYLDAGFEPDILVQEFKCPLNKVKRLKSKSRTKIPDEVKEAILVDLDSKMTHVEIAAKYGISASMVSKINPVKVAKPKSRPLDETDWQLAKASLQRYSVSEVARMHNVSRAYIYGRLAKEKA